jgi:predicted ABC-type transport system involved in lysophospholipase L1 biosynthesis ATPase subunit
MNSPAPAAAAAIEPMIRAGGLFKTYQTGRRALDVLRGVDLTIHQGEFVALRGASGAGKSTLLHLLGGLDQPTRGDVWFQGQNFATMSNAALARARNALVGFVFQAYYLLPELDALENVCLPARIRRVNAAVAEARGRSLLERVGLAERLEHLPTELSGGEQQRVAIARALMNEPVLLLADEPTGNLDSHTGAEIIDLLCALRAERNTTMVIATHDAKVAARAPRALELVDGQLGPMTGPPAA